MIVNGYVLRRDSLVELCGILQLTLEAFIKLIVRLLMAMTESVASKIHSRLWLTVLSLLIAHSPVHLLILLSARFYVFISLSCVTAVSIVTAWPLRYPSSHAKEVKVSQRHL